MTEALLNTLKSRRDSLLFLQDAPTELSFFIRTNYKQVALTGLLDPLDFAEKRPPSRLFEPHLVEVVPIDADVAVFGDDVDAAVLMVDVVRAA